MGNRPGLLDSCVVAPRPRMDEEAPVRELARAESVPANPPWDNPDQLDLDFETFDALLRRRRARRG